MKTSSWFKFFALFFISVFAFAEFWASVSVFNYNSYQGKVFTALRAQMLDKNNTEFIEQPYLGYSNCPTPVNYDSTYEINNLGLKRLGKTTVEKPDSIYRILFLGGPSTWGANNNVELTFPGIIEKSLNQSKAGILSPRYKKYECLNAGLLGATSAELLIQYLLKYQYLKPDLIVIHTGFNDAFTYLCRTYGVQYQPDYHTAKRMYKEPNYDFGMFRYLFLSKAISFIAINIFYHDFVTSAPPYNPFFQYKNYNLWFENGNDSIFSIQYNAFYNNLKNLITIAKSNNQKVLLVPEFYYKYDPLFGKNNEESFKEGFFANERFLQKLSIDLEVQLCSLKIKNFTPDMFPPEEDRYVNEKGEAMKAKLILPYIQNLIGGDTSN